MCVCVCVCVNVFTKNISDYEVEACVRAVAVSPFHGGVEEGREIERERERERERDNIVIYIYSYSDCEVSGIINQLDL
jgi:hypothetical protein